MEQLLFALSQRKVRRTMWSPDGRYHFGHGFAEGQPQWYWRTKDYWRGLDYRDHWEETCDIVQGHSPSMELVITPR